MGGLVKGVGKIAGPIIGGITNGPAGFATSLASNAIMGNYGGGGGGGSNVPKYAKPEYNYGNQTYQLGNNPVDASKYFITGDKGVYNLMPALGQIDAKTLQSSNPIYSDSWSNSVANKTYYTPYEAYTDLSKQMANDPKALAAFQAAYKPTTPTSRGVSPYVDFGMSGSIGDNATFADLAKYASTNQNPYYIPFNASGGKTSAFERTLNPQEILRQKQAANQARLAKMTPEAIAAERAANQAQNAERRAQLQERLQGQFRPDRPTGNASAGFGGLAGLYRGRQ